MKVGVVGFGNLGRFLVEEIQKRNELELGFVWNRTFDVLHGVIDEQYILKNLEEFSNKSVDLIVEVAHPTITEAYGALFLQHADYMLGSPTALADHRTEQLIRSAATCHGLYVPTGAFWGGEDIKKMADRGTLNALKITMTKPPLSFKVLSPLREKNDAAAKENKRTVLYDGCVRDLCPLAPNNVNTMAAAALAAHNLGFDEVQGCIIADPEMVDWHVVEIEVWGSGDRGHAFQVATKRRNPARVGHVTGTATYQSFLSSMLGAHGKGAGVHLC